MKFFNGVILKLFLILSLNILIHAEYIGKDIYTIDLTNYDNEYSSGGDVEMPISENGKWALLEYYTGTWSDGDRSYHMFKLNLETGEKFFIDFQHNSFERYSLLGISDDGNKIIYKNRTGNGYGNYYLYDFSTKVEENILIGPDNSSPNRQCYNGVTDVKLDQFAVMSFATNWYNGTEGHVYYRDLISKKTILVDKGINGEEANATPNDKIGIISKKYVIYESSASNIVSNDDNDKKDIFLYDISNKTNKKISFNVNGTAFNESASLVWYDDNNIIFSVSGKLYIYNILSDTVKLNTNQIFDKEIRISKDGNEVLYVTTNKQNQPVIKFYNRALGVDTIVYRGYISERLQYYAQIKNNRVFFFDKGKLTSLTPDLNQLPIANPGKDQAVYEGNAVTLSAANSSDSDGTIVSYEWSENGVILSNDVNFTKDDFSVGVHTITLKVTDDDGASSEANVTITINEFPKEELNANGSYTNSFDTVNTKRIYTFTLDEKSQVNIDANSDTMKVGAWVVDENGSKISNLENWQAGANSQFSYGDILKKGKYSIEFFPQNAGETGDFSFTFNTNLYSDVIQNPWFVNIPKHITVAHDETINICLSVEANSGINLNTDDLNISSDNLPNGLSITKSYLVDCDFNLEGKIEATDDFSINLNISDGNITKEHNIDFSVKKLILEGIIGDGPSGEMAIRESNLNEYTPFKVAFDLRGDIENIQSVSCLFGDKLDFGIDNIKYIDYTIQGKVLSSGKYICDAESAKSEDFVGVASGNQLMNRLVALNESERYMTVEVTLKDGSTITKKILKKIPIINVEKPIQLWYEKMQYAEPFVSLSIYRKNGNQEVYNNISDYALKTHFNLDYGDKIMLKGGRWILKVGNHQMFMNLDKYTTSLGNSPVPFIIDINKDLDKNRTILGLDGIKVGEKIALYFQRTGHETLKKISLLLSSGTIWTKKTIESLDLPEEQKVSMWGSDAVTAAVRGTTFTLKIKDGHASYDLYEGALDINKSGKETNLKTMQSYQCDNGSVKTITNVSVPSSVKNYFDETSLSLADLNSTISTLDITTNSDKASYILIGDHVSFGGGKLNVINNIVEGNYTLQFAPLLWNKKPADRNITFDINNLKETVEANYQKIVDVFINGIAQNKKVDINVSRTNIKIDQLDDESILALTKINDRNSSLSFSTLNSKISVDVNGTTIANLPLAQDVKIIIDKNGKVKPIINGTILPKDGFPLGTEVKIIGDKVKFIVPMNEILSF